MEVQYNFHDLHEIVKYEEFYERSYVENFLANCTFFFYKNSCYKNHQAQNCQKI